jgi:hypothetical protein
MVFRKLFSLIEILTGFSSRKEMKVHSSTIGEEKMVAVTLMCAPLVKNHV